MTSRSAHDHTLLLASLLVLIAAALPSAARAQSDVSIFSYGTRGLLNGAEVGLAAGYLSTGARYESGEWRNLIVGTGVGALAGLGLGLTLGIADDSSDPPATGLYVLRDMGYGTLLGSLVGTAVGALFLIDSGRTKNLVTGAAVGALIGAGTGIAFGVFESSNEARRKRKGKGAAAAISGGSLSLGLMPSPGFQLPLAGMSGTF